MKTNPTDLVLLDTNILVGAELRKETHHEAAKSLRDRALNGEVAACISPQVLSEFFSVVTNTGPRGPEDPLTPQEALAQVKKYYESDCLTLIYPGPKTVEWFLTLLERHPVSGPRVHDVHLAATMLDNGVRRIYTFNIKDFAPFSEIEALTPPEPAPVSEQSTPPSP